MSDTPNKPGLLSPHTRQSKAAEWHTIFRVLAVISAGFAFLICSGLWDTNNFNPVTGLVGAVGALLGFLPLIALFSVLRFQEA